MEHKNSTEEQLLALIAEVDDFNQFRDALMRESDRGCALFAAAYIDKALGKLLKSHLVQGSKVDEELFTGQAPLGSFSSRIKLAYYLGRISAAERKDLDTIRQIRNDFAHNAAALTFSDQSIANRCGNLTHTWREVDASPRQKYTAGVSGLMINISHATRTAIAFQEREDSPIPREIVDVARTQYGALSASIQSKKKE